MFASARRAYDDVSRTAGNNRELEARALFKAARELEACAAAWDEPDRDARLERALRFNQRLWTLFQTELASPEHPMPPELRVNLLRLSAFVDKRTFELMATPSAEGIQALVQLNREIAAGLGNTPAK